MSKFKVGDFVKLEGWMDFYEIIDKTDVSIKLKIDLPYTQRWYSFENKFIKKEEAMKLELGGKYRKVGTHEPVRVICTDRVSSDVAKEFTCVSLVRTKEDFEYMLVTTAEGKNPSGEVLFEKVPEIDWSKVPVDAHVWIKENGKVFKRHFCKFDEGLVYVYPNGKTSFTFDVRDVVQCVGIESETCYLENQEV